MDETRCSCAPPALILLAALVFLPGAAQAQKLYKCQKDGKVFFSNKPCTGAPGSVQSSSPFGSKVTTLERPAPGRSYSPDDKELLASIQKELPALTDRCASGDAWVCDLLACVLKADPQACARAEGRLSGNGWRERSRKEIKVQSSDPRQGPVTETETELLIECVPGPAVHRVYWTADGKAYYREGGSAAGGAAGTATQSRGGLFTTIEEAAAAACGGKTEAGSQKPEAGG